MGLAKREEGGYWVALLCSDRHGMGIIGAIRGCLVLYWIANRCALGIRLDQWYSFGSKYGINTEYDYNKMRTYE